MASEIKACESCAKSKRKCGKERPRCHRCSSRDMDCVYPPARPSSFVLLPEDHETPASFGTSTSFNGTCDLWDPNILLCPLPELAVPLSACDVDLQLAKPALAPPKNQTLDWFMAPETWKSIPLDPREPRAEWTPPYANTALKRFLKALQHRLSQWPSTGGTDFLHKHLYSFRNPRCVQDAQTALALYLARTDENEDAVFRTLGDRARQLLEDEAPHKTTSSLDVFGHLARVHALMTYQVIGLLDGDIHLRAVAEGRTEVLKTWLDQMIESVWANSGVCTGDVDDDIVFMANWLGIGINDSLAGGQAARSPLVREEVVWHMWVFAESLRRTWITGHALLITYHALQKGWAVCQGSMKITAGKGLWDAPSSYAWSKLLRESKVLFMEGTATERLFLEARPDEVDDFTKGIMEMSHGFERMVRWAATVVA